jgi:DNA-binding response OmpR family regulator
MSHLQPTTFDSATPLAGLRIFVAEDEFHVLQLIEDMLAELGCAVCDSVSNVRSALDRAAATKAQVAVLEINLRGKAIFPVAEVLRRRGIPIVFSTGYGIGGLEPEWKTCPVIQKPFSIDRLERVLRQLQDQAADASPARREFAATDSTGSTEPTRPERPIRSAVLSQQAVSFLYGGGEMGERIRAMDWSRTALGTDQSEGPGGRDRGLERGREGLLSSSSFVEISEPCLANSSKRRRSEPEFGQTGNCS